MNRRHFFSGLLGAGAATAVAAPTKQQCLPDKFERNGWAYKWTGYKEGRDSSFIVGQWIAKRIKPTGRTIDDPFSYWHPRSADRAYWSSNGYGNFYHPGSAFDITLSEGWQVIDVHSTERERKLNRDRAAQELMKFLDENG